MAKIVAEVVAYERWLRGQCAVVEADLDRKHQKMRASAFNFLRATCFRWAGRLGALCPELVDAPAVLSVGDAHVENFGTWRDGQARLVWGVDDFDDAATLPYAYDLVRLATSARLAPKLRISGSEAAEAILDGYAKGLAEPRPALLDEGARWLRALVSGRPDAASEFWERIDRAEPAEPPAALRAALKRHLPTGFEGLRFTRVSKGAGSLGRPRYQAVAQWQEGRVAVEAKASVPSAWHWARADAHEPSRLLSLAHGAHRSPDPSLCIEAGFVLRRVAPDAHKVELKDVAEDGLDDKLLGAMGADLGAIHAADAGAARIGRDLHSRNGKWLQRAAAAAEHAVREDFDDYARG